MANLAIRGHETRGKEVIELLEMLGTCNPEGYVGSGDWYYCIADNEIIRVYYWNNFTVFTLEEFLEKYPFKVGDRVRIPEYESEVRICKMRWSNFGYVEYLVYRCDEEVWYSAQELKEYNADFLSIKACGEPYKEETEEGVYAYNEINCYHQDFGDKVRIRLGGDFEIKIEDKLTYIVRKKPQYPKTYEECCSVLGMTYDYPDIQMVSIEECNLYSSFIQLIRCRNAYWKIAGEQMGLEKPWEPDLVNEDLYCIYNYRGEIIKDKTTLVINKILIFPTEEMRDAFWKNFYNLIKVCKELL